MDTCMDRGCFTLQRSLSVITCFYQMSRGYLRTAKLTKGWGSSQIYDGLGMLIEFIKDF